MCNFIPITCEYRLHVRGKWICVFVIIMVSSEPQLNESWKWSFMLWFLGQIPCLALDDIFSVKTDRTLVELTPEEQTKVDTCPGMTPLLPSSLLEINCLLLLPQQLAKDTQQGKRSSISYAEILEALLTAGFHFIGLRMLLLGVANAADCANLYSASLPAGWKPHHLVRALGNLCLCVWSWGRAGGDC